MAEKAEKHEKINCKGEQGAYYEFAHDGLEDGSVSL